MIQLCADKVKQLANGRTTAYYILDDGEPVGKIIVYSDGKKLYANDFMGPGSRNFGFRRVRDVVRCLKEDYPECTTFHAVRLTGAAYWNSAPRVTQVAL